MKFLLRLSLSLCFWSLQLEAWATDTNQSAILQATQFGPNDLILGSTGTVAHSSRNITVSNLLETLAGLSNFQLHVPVQAVAPTNGIYTITNGQLLTVGLNLVAGANVTFSTNGNAITVSAPNVPVQAVAPTNGIYTITNGQAVSVGLNVVAGANVTFTTNGNVITIASTGGGSNQSSTNATFYLASSMGFFNVGMTNGTLLASISNGMVTFNTNVVINGNLTINSSTNTDWNVNHVSTGWITASNGFYGDGSHLTGISVFPLSADANANQFSITNISTALIGNPYGWVYIASNGITFYSTNSPVFQVNDQNTNALFSVAGSNNLVQINGTLLESNLTSRTFFYNAGTNFQLVCVGTNGGGGFLTNQFHFGNGSGANLLKAVNSSGATELLADSSGNVMTPAALKSDSQVLTNALDYKWTPFSGPTNAIDFSHVRQSYTATTDMNISNVLNAPLAGFERHTLLWVTNSTGSDVVLRATLSGVLTDDGARSYTITNKSSRTFQFICNDMGVRLISRPWF